MRSSSLGPCVFLALPGRICRPAGGAYVNIIGVGGRTGSAEFTIGGSVNAALMNLTKALADRGVEDGVRVNAVNPGSIATERLQTRIKNYARDKNITREEAAQQMPREMRIARFGNEEFDEEEGLTDTRIWAHVTVWADAAGIGTELRAICGDNAVTGLKKLANLIKEAAKAPAEAQVEADSKKATGTEGKPAKAKK